MQTLLSIGDLARRTGVSVSAIRFYEEQGLVQSLRAPSGHRRFARAEIRRLSLLRAAQELGFSLAEIGETLKSLPQDHAPTKADWTSIAAGFRRDIEARIAGLEALRDRLDGCIGCGCLSLKACRLLNPNDQAAERGDGPRYLLGDSAPDDEG